MKRIATLSAMLVFASASAFATEVDIDMLVHDVEIYQAQDGTDLTQRAVISPATPAIRPNLNLTHLLPL